jgi:transmembrane sensor
MTDGFPPRSDHELLRYLSGECSAEQTAEIERTVASDPTEQRRLETMRRVWLASEKAGPTWDTERIWSRVRPVHEEHRAAPRLAEFQPSPPFRFGSRWIGIAAVALMGVGGAIAIARSSGRGSPDSLASPTREIVTGPGQRAEVRLGDGSRVILGVDSRLRFPVTLSAASRDLELIGQAYFDVRHDERRPFRVRAAGVITEDLGTEFVIRAYSGDSAVQVAVVSGQVAVSRETDSASVRPTTLVEGDLATLGRERAVSVLHHVDVASYAAWTTGRIEFHQADLAEVARELKRWYGVNIRLVGPGLEQPRVTGSFRYEPLDQVLHLIAATLNLSVERTGDVVTLRHK